MIKSGTGLIDGHPPVEVDDDALAPVLIVDLPLIELLARRGA